MDSLGYEMDTEVYNLPECTKDGIEEKQCTQSFGKLHFIESFNVFDNAKVGAVCCTLLIDELLQEEDRKENLEAAIDKVISFCFCLLGNETFLQWTQVVDCSLFCLCIAQLQFLWYGLLSISMPDIDKLPSEASFQLLQSPLSSLSSSLL